MHRVVGLVSLAPPDDVRVEWLARALTERGHRVVIFGPPGEAAPALEALGVERVGVGGSVAHRPRLREVLRFGAGLAVQVVARRLRRRLDILLVHGGDEALALLGALPRLTGVRLVLDLDTGREGRAAGLSAAVASATRGPALRLVDAAVASDEVAAERLRQMGLGAVEIAAAAPPLPDLERRETQPRVTVNSPVRLWVAAVAARAPDELAGLLASVAEAEPKLVVDLEGAVPSDAARLEERLGISVAPAPRASEAGFRDRLEAAHVALLAGGGEAEALPFLVVGIPVVGLGAEIGGLAADEAARAAAGPEEAAQIVAELLRSSRDRRELAKQGWAWLEGRRGACGEAALARALGGAN